MKPIQYTIRNIPPSVDRVIRKQSQQQGVSFNQTVVDLLAMQTLGTTDPAESDQGFDWLFDVNTLDKTFDESIASMEHIDERLWHQERRP